MSLPPCRYIVLMMCCVFQYMGNETSPKVKGKVQSLLYSWKIGLPHEPKIAEAYELLKEQGVSPFCDEALYLRHDVCAYYLCLHVHKCAVYTSTVEPLLADTLSIMDTY